MFGSLHKKAYEYCSILTLVVPLAACADVSDDASHAAQTLAAEVAPGAAVAESPPAGPQAKIVQLAATGEGCKAGTTEIAVSPDGARAEARFAAYDVAIGPERERAEVKGCELRVVARAPTGFYFAFHRVQVDVEAGFEPGVTASLNARQYFPASGSVAYLRNMPLASPLTSSEPPREVVFPTEQQLQQAACGAEQEVRLQTMISLHDQAHTARGSVRVRRIQVDAADMVVKPCGTP